MAEDKITTKRRSFWDCGVPQEECTGALVASSGPKSRRYKAHGSQDDAKACSVARALRLTKLGDGIYLPTRPILVKPGKAGRAMVPAIRG